jgi:hypothetical protein
MIAIAIYTDIGWRRQTNGKWLLVFTDAPVHEIPPPEPPELTIDQVADKLNALEAQIESAKP